MKKVFMLNLFFFLTLNIGLVADDVIGFWKTVDEKTKTAQSIVAIYEYQGKCFGRIVATLNDDGSIKDTMNSPITRAPGIKGEAFYSGMDIIWNLQKSGTKYTNGSILDPEHGKVYDAEIWTKNGNLIVRGHIFIFGRNQTWIPARDSDFTGGFKKPDLTTFIPKIPQVK